MPLNTSVTHLMYSVTHLMYSVTSTFLDTAAILEPVLMMKTY